jgi:hypothetical protein
MTAGNEDFTARTQRKLAGFSMRGPLKDGLQADISCTGVGGVLGLQQKVMPLPGGLVPVMTVCEHFPLFLLLQKGYYNAQTKDLKLVRRGFK